MGYPLGDMDRRGFLKVLGVGGVAVAAAPQLVLPKVRLPGAEPKVFTPPVGGWRSLPSVEEVANWRLAELNPPVVQDYDLIDATAFGDRNRRYLRVPRVGIHRWSVDVERPLQPGEDIGYGRMDEEVPVGNARGWLVRQDITYTPFDGYVMRERYEGVGDGPDFRSLGPEVRVKVHHWLEPGLFSYPTVRV
jgi:hypothetical protein